MILNTIFNRFSSQKALIIGDVMVDAYLWGKVERISPEAPIPVLQSTRRENRLGGAANVALNIRSLGATPILCSVIGTDSESEVFLSCLKQNNLSSNGIVQVADRPTTLKQRILSGSQHMLRIDTETDRPLYPDITALLLERIRKELPGCDVVLFEDYDKGVITPELIQTVVQWANEAGIPTVVDPKKRNFWAYEGVTLFKPNLKEFKEGLHIDVAKDDFKGMCSAARNLRDKTRAQITLITLSEHGVLIASNEEEHQLPAHVRTISDVSGAGDTVVSVAALTLAQKLPLRTIASLSNLAGGIVCEAVGVVPIEVETLKREAEISGEDF